MNKAITLALFARILASLLGRSVWRVVTHEIAIVEQLLPLRSCQ
jgi:hypothetical protein